MELQMNIIKKSIRKFINWAMSDEESAVVREKDKVYASNMMGKSTGINLGHNSNGFEDSSGMTFIMYAAKSGGKIIQTVQYDHLLDRRKTGLYIIADKENFGNELEQIITRELLSR
jgi:hypothetical protein